MIKNPRKSFNKFSCLNFQFGGRKWVLIGTNHFLAFFILWSKVQKRKENIENDVLKMCKKIFVQEPNLGGDGMSVQFIWKVKCCIVNITVFDTGILSISNPMLV